MSAPADHASRRPAAPRVSIVIPAYNAADTIGATLDSVLAQTDQDFEIVVVNDGSTDATAAVVAAYSERDARIVLLGRANGGVAAARNMGVAAARGTWIAWLDADDVWHPRKLDMQMSVAGNDPQRPGVVYCWSRAIDAQGRVLRDLNGGPFQGDVHGQLILRNFIGNASAPVALRSLMLAAGGFDETLKQRGLSGCEDLGLLLALARRTSFAVVPLFLVGYRTTGSQMSADFVRMARSWDAALARELAENPLVPRRTVRWGRGAIRRWAAFGEWRAGRVLRGLALALQALVFDPVGSTVLGLERFRSVLAPRRSAAAKEPPRPFLDCDPAMDMREVPSRFQVRRQRLVEQATGRHGPGRDTGRILSSHRRKEGVPGGVGSQDPMGPPA